MKNSRDGPLLLKLLSFDQRGRTGVDLSRISQKPVFILSTGRTGTQFLAKFLNRQKNIRAVHEPKPSWRLRFWSMARLMGEVDDSRLAEVLWRYRSGFFDGLSDEVYVESNNFLAGFSEAIKQQFKDPVIIHVVRDPRDYVRSQINHGAGLRGAAKRLANRHLPYAHFSKSFIRRHTGQAAELSFARAALFWRLVNERLEAAGDDYPHYYRFKFEELFGKNTESLEEVLEIAGASGYSKDELRVRDKKANPSKRGVMPPWQEWSEEQIEVIERVCGQLMKKYGYGDEAEWRERIDSCKTS